MAVPRMRTAEKVLEEIKAADPNTEVTLYYIRALIRAEAVPVVSCGRKKLVNVDSVMELLARGYTLPESNPAPSPQTVGGIRRVSI